MVEKTFYFMTNNVPRYVLILSREKRIYVYSSRVNLSFIHVYIHFPSHFNSDLGLSIHFFHADMVKNVVFKKKNVDHSQKNFHHIKHYALL